MMTTYSAKKTIISYNIRITVISHKIKPPAALYPPPHKKFTLFRALKGRKGC